MARSLTDAERERLSTFPEEGTEEDLAAYFTLSSDDLAVVRRRRGNATVIERLVITAREQLEKETYRRLALLLTDERTAQLDALLVRDPTIGPSRFAWLRKGATAAKPRAILAELDKLNFVRALGAAGWDLSMLNPNRLKFLAQLARRSDAQALQRATVERRMTALVAFLAESVWQFTHEVVDLFDRTPPAQWATSTI